MAGAGEFWGFRTREGVCSFKGVLREKGSGGGGVVCGWEMRGVGWGGCGEEGCRIICTQRQGMYYRWRRYRYIPSFLCIGTLFFCAVSADRSPCLLTSRGESSAKRRMVRSEGPCP